MAGNIGRQVGRILRRALREAVRNYQRSEGSPGGGLSKGSRKVAFPFGKSPSRSTTSSDPATTQVASPHAAREYRMPATGLPRLEYAPSPDGEADPGEVAWAWVPYEEDASKGKDRPILIISEVTGGYLALQMTSKDHSKDREREASFGRHWLDIGSGPWDSKRRDSEVRLDRLLFVPLQGVRREGATLPKDRYLEVAEALHALHG